MSGGGKKLAIAAGIAFLAAGSHGHHHWANGVLASFSGHSASANERLGHRMAAHRGWTGPQWSCLDELWRGESGWRTNADTRASGLDPAGASVYAYGIPQARPADKLATAGPHWQTSARTQIRWGIRYISRTYGNPCNALAFKRAHGNAGY